RLEMEIDDAPRSLRRGDPNGVGRGRIWSGSEGSAGNEQQDREPAKGRFGVHGIASMPRGGGPDNSRSEQTIAPVESGNRVWHAMRGDLRGGARLRRAANPIQSRPTQTQ